MGTVVGGFGFLPSPDRSEVVGCRPARSPASASAAAQEIKAIGRVVSDLDCTQLIGKRVLARLSLGPLVQFFARLPSEDPFKATRSSFGLTEMVTLSLWFCSRPLIQFVTALDRLACFACLNTRAGIFTEAQMPP
jgi:hypothetical protein